MRRFILVLLMSLFATTAFAEGRSGLYFNADEPGDGFSIAINGTTLVLYFWTYKEHQDCYDINIPDDTILDDSNCHMPLFFLNSGDLIGPQGGATGFLYAAHGLDYPYGIPDPKNPFKSQLAVANVVGIYILVRLNDGYQMKVLRVGEFLDEDNILFTNLWDFPDRLFIVDEEVEAEPK